MDFHYGLISLLIVGIPVLLTFGLFTYFGYEDRKLLLGVATGLMLAFIYALFSTIILFVLFQYDHGYRQTVVSEEALYEIPVESDNSIYVVRRMGESGLPTRYEYSTKKVSILEGLESLSNNERAVISPTEITEPVLRKIKVSKVCDPADWVQDWFGMCRVDNHFYYDFQVPGTGVYTEFPS